MGICLLPKRYTIIKIKARSCYMSYYQLKKKKEKKKFVTEKSKDDEKRRVHRCCFAWKKKVEIKTFDDINAYEYVIYDWSTCIVLY